MIDDPLDLTELKEILRKFTYRPGWRFSIDREAMLVINATVVDTDDHNKLIPLSFGTSIPSYTYKEFDWTRWLFEQCMTVERHEAQEFFKIGGIKVYDPHG